MRARLISRRLPWRHRGRCPALILTICEGCCKGDVSSISCNESTPHTSSISPTEICLLLAMVLMGVSLIVRASNPCCFSTRLFSICFRLIEEVRTEDPMLVFPTHGRCVSFATPLHYVECLVVSFSCLSSRLVSSSL